MDSAAMPNLGNEHCDPIKVEADDDDDAPVFECLVTNASAMTMDFLQQNATSEEKACYCSVIGLAVISQDDDLHNGICRDWLVSLGQRMLFVGLATGVVVV